MPENAPITEFLGKGLLKSVGLKGFKGFTLAEVLITLVIIGVIASMTIPTLMNNTNKQEYVSRLKKAYSALSQATNKIIADEGNPNPSIGGWAVDTEAVYNMYKKYLSVAKDCGYNTAGCFDGTYKQMNNTTLKFTNRYTFVLSDGTLVALNPNDYNAECARSGTGSYNVCQLITVDINGAKGPNEVGKDAFTFGLKENALFPAGCDTPVSQCSSSQTGWACACKVLREGAINY